MLELIKRIINAKEGKKIWKNIRSTWGDEDVPVVMIPDKSLKIYRIIMDNIKEYMIRKRFSRAIVICKDEFLKGIDSCTDNQIKLIALSDTQMDAVTSYYRLHQFYDNFIFASIEEPYGNTVGQMLDSKKIEIGELVRASIFR